MTDFFAFMFRDPATAWGMGLFIIIVVYLIGQTITNVFSTFGNRNND